MKRKVHIWVCCWKSTTDHFGLEMKLSVLLLLALPALTSAFHTVLGEDISELDLRDVVPEIPHRLIHRAYPITSTISRAMGELPSAKFERTNLEWQQWTGSVPNGAVYIYNGYMSRYDYVCKHKCASGYYNIEQGDYCVFPYGGKALKSSEFSLLVNKEEFEILEWKEGAYGSVAWNGVKTCQDEDIYVGKNEYGLGKVQVSHRVFYLPYNGWEYNYEKPYQFLVIHEDVKNEHLMDVKYNTDGVPVVEHPPETLKSDTIQNSACDEATLSDTLTKSTKVEHKWENNYSLSFAGSTSITTKIPFITSAGIQFNMEVNLMFTSGTTYSETTSHSIKVQAPIPAGHSCIIEMVAKKYGADIPYTAQLRRTYNNGENKWTTITGTYKSIQITEVQAVVSRCEPLPNVKPC
ncbi:natterin-3-like isoform X1 [Nerophis ophidion]|uniref:natterin-3-like isoform X1 n=1 Tax=Nerophis ophidion TaxID=159077 RepID=UPI002ADF0C2B|nr:natterin-3-like isoform X1 [Nerophis ophidion]